MTSACKLGRPYITLLYLKRTRLIQLLPVSYTIHNVPALLKLNHTLGSKAGSNQCPPCFHSHQTSSTIHASTAAERLECHPARDCW
jgi:hypothetical protein